MSEYNHMIQGPRSDHSPDCRGCLDEEKMWNSICDWETDRHEDRHVALHQFVEACNECQNEEVDSEMEYVSPEQSEKEFKESWNV
jgi:hypothetical protein